MAEEQDRPLTREDVLKRIEANGGTAKGLDLSGKVFEEGIDLSNLDLAGITLNNATLFHPSHRGQKIAYASLEHANLMCANLQGVDLVCANLEGADLGGAHLERAKLWNANLEGADLRGAHLEGAVLIEANLEEADLASATLEGADLRGARLTGAYWQNVEFTGSTKLDDVYWGDYVLGQESFGDIFLLSTYRRLRSWYAEHGMNDIAAKFYYREMEVRRKGAGWSWNPYRARHRFGLEALRAVFGYGEHWDRVLYCMALVIFGSAAAYYVSGELNLPYSLYFSVISFTALGYGKWVDIAPQGWVQALGAFQSFAGVFLMALLLVTFFRKWTR